MNKLNLSLLSFVLIAVVAIPSIAHAVTPTSTKGIITFTSTTATDATWDILKQCTSLKEVTPDNDVAYIDVPDNLVADSHLVKFLFFQSIALGGNPFSTTPKSITYYSCPAELFAKVQAESQISTQSTIPKMLTSAFSWVIDAINALLTWVLGWAGYLLIVMIGQGKFITSDIVRQAWPFVQGIANLGFIFALLYIALATTLRMESVTTSIQKLLPKLLVAALLVNFSLVIGGLLIDASRLLMAVEIRLLGNGLDYENFTKKLTEKSNQVGTTLAAISNVDSNNGSALVLKLIQSSLFLGLLTAAILLIAANLFIRYVVLLILLILSPMAYLALALPNTSKYASQWWGMFIKWVLYGPIVLFFLIIITRVQNIDVALSADASLNKPFIAFFNQFIHFAIIIALFFVGNSVAKKVAGVGSDAVLGFAKKNPRAALIAGASLASGGFLGGAAAAALTSRSARDFYKQAGSNTLAGVKGIPGIKQISKVVTPGKRDKEGDLLPGQNSIGTMLADYTNPLNPKTSKEISDVKKLNDITRDNVGNNALVPTQLAKGHVASALELKNVKAIFNYGSQAQRMAIVGNKDYIASLKPEDMQDLQQFISNSTHTPAVKAVEGTPAKAATYDSYGAMTSPEVAAKDAIPEKKAEGIKEDDKAKVLEKIGKTVEDLKK